MHSKRILHSQDNSAENKENSENSSLYSWTQDFTPTVLNFGKENLVISFSF